MIEAGHLRENRLVLWLMVVPWIGYGLAAAVLAYAFYDFTGGLKLWTLSV